MEDRLYCIRNSFLDSPHAIPSAQLVGQEMIGYKLYSVGELRQLSFIVSGNIFTCNSATAEEHQKSYLRFIDLIF